MTFQFLFWEEKIPDKLNYAYFNKKKKEFKLNMHYTSWIVHFTTLLCTIRKLKHLGRGRGLERVVGGDKEGKTHRFDVKAFQWYIHLILALKKSKSEGIRISSDFNGGYKSFLFTEYNDQYEDGILEKKSLTFFFSSKDGAHQLKYSLWKFNCLRLRILW